MGRVDIYPFCAIGDTGQRYPNWFRKLDGRSGVYLIREHDPAEIAYVVESQSDRLYDEDADEANGQDAEDDDPGQRAPPRGYDYDIDDIIDALFYVPSASEDSDADIPF